MTPVALYAEMVRTAESLLNRQAAETVVWRGCSEIPASLTLLRRIPRRSMFTRMIRRQEWLAAAAPDDEPSEAAAAPAARLRTADRFGLDLDEFKMKTNRRPRDFKKCLRIAEWTAEDKVVEECGTLRSPHLCFPSQPGCTLTR